jgi:integrase
MAFLAKVPLSWISRRKAAPLTAGWAPFKSQPRLASQALALTAINACHVWLVAARYLTFNPWHLVNRRLGDDPQRDGSDPTSRAFTPAAWSALRDQVAEDGQAKRARDRDSALRNLWLLSFGEACGLRAAELLDAQLKDLVLTPEGWVIKVLGKGRRQRQVPVPSRALAATRAYLATRGIDMDLADPETPLMAAVGDPKAAISYSALSQAIKSLAQRAARRLPVVHAATMVRASHHWLRHTHATRAAERQVPLDALQENLGQADPRTTARYYRAQIRRRAQLMEEAFGGRE